MHKKYKVFAEQMDKLKGQMPTQDWVNETLQALIKAGATRADLEEISENIKNRYAAMSTIQ